MQVQKLQNIEKNKLAGLSMVPTQGNGKVKKQDIFLHGMPREMAGAIYYTFGKQQRIFF